MLFRSWSYGAYGWVDEARDHGAFVVRTSVQADKTAPAVAEVLKELAAARAAPSAEVLGRARVGMAKALAGNFETNSATAQSFVGMPAWGLGGDLWVNWLADLGRADAAAVAAQAKRVLDPDHMLVVVVGPRTIEDEGKTVDVVKELQALGYEFVEAKAP